MGNPTQTAEASAPALGDLINRVEDISEALAEAVPRCEEQRRLPDETIEALEHAGMFKIFTPAEFGGYAADVGTLAEVAKRLAWSCPSSAWVAVISNGSALLAAHFPEEARQEVFGDDPSVRVASVFAPSGAARPVPGGYRVSGKWPWASGSLHAHWGIGLVPIVDDAGSPTGAGIALMPMNDLTVEDTWYTVGMRGTGSNTMVADDVFVPAHRMLAPETVLASPKQTDRDAPTQLRCAPTPALIAALSAPMVGVAQAALAFVTEKAPKRAISYTVYGAQAESAAFVQGLGAAAMKVETADMHLRQATETIDRGADDARVLTLEQRRRVRGHVGHTAHQVCDAFNDFMTLHGSSAFAEISPLQRMWRDANTGCRHAAFSTPVNYELHGGALLGLPAISQLL